MPASISAEDQASIDHLFDFLEGRTSKKKIKKYLEVASGNRDFALELLSSSQPEGEDFSEDEVVDDQAKQDHIREYHEVVNGITDSAIRSTIDNIMGLCPYESPRHVLNVFRHFHGNKEDTVNALFDQFVVPTEKRDKMVIRQDAGKGRSREGASGKVIKSEPSEYFSKNPLTSRRDTSSDLESRPPYTPPSSSSTSSPQHGLPMRPIPGADWSFGELPTLPESPKIPAYQLTDDDGFEVEGANIEVSPVKNEIDDEDLYGLPLENIATSSRKATDPGLSSLSDEDADIEMSPPKDDSGSGSDTEHEVDTDHCGGGEDEDDSDVDMSSGTSLKKTHLVRDASREEGKEEEEEEEVKLTQDEKEAHLLSLFPKAGIEGVRRELQLNFGRMTDTAADLEDQYGLGGSDRDESGTVSPGVGPSRARTSQTACLKRPAVGGRQPKRSRSIEEEPDAEEEENNHESADKWVLSFLHTENGVQIELDSGIHPCRVPKAALLKVPGFRDWLEANSRQDKAMKITNVSLETFNLAMMWIVCSVGRLTPNQRRSKSDELTALIDLAVFAESVSLPLGNKTEWFMSSLKTTLVKYRKALRGSHIRRAFEDLRGGHQVRKLLVQASLRAYVEFHYHESSPNCSVSQAKIFVREGIQYS
ncbi:hypothetical protein ONS95_007758 [Cadophora gregata]|uniref:uncharacterized protein n=1 Tax=Cadophora gregata TaxID=51156 RepID=UPI0026DC8E5E|nr:uncharacterized protein ONS95_007758 [Cadophora gregata]KAK0126139.1 hypothetical protein ONS95_007758 [Cadophora gregata]